MSAASDESPRRGGDRRLSIALVAPTYWPEVRRGTERMVHDLAQSMTERGHRVEILTAHRGLPSRTEEEGVVVRRTWRPPEPLPTLRAHEYHMPRAITAARQLRRGDYDVAHAFFPTDAWAAARLSARGEGPPAIFAFQGYPAREYLVARRLRLEMLELAVARSAATCVLSEAAAEPFRRYLRREPRVIPPGVACGEFAVERHPPSAPTLLCTASLGDPRKRGPLLAEAFERLRAELPEVRLVIAAPPDPVMSRSEPELPEGVERIEANDTASLARAYASATASVLAAPGEAFGLVMVESLAAGTPVVAARSGAVPEIVDEGETGALFEVDDAAGLAEAMRRALEIGADPAAVDRCRDSAARFDWATIGERFEELYLEVAEGPRFSA